MPRLVTMVAEIIDEACTGCDLCVKVCPTLALRLEPRQTDEPGRGKRIARIKAEDCYNVQNCLEICPEDAIVMRELEEPFNVQLDQSNVDVAAVNALVAKSGFPGDAGICTCTGTTVKEIAAAIILGADTPEAISLATGARTGCTEICAHAVLSILKAAGHDDKAKTLEEGYQTYGVCGTLYEHFGSDGKLPSGIEQEFSDFKVYEDIADMAVLKAQRSAILKSAEAQVVESLEQHAG